MGRWRNRFIARGLITLLSLWAIGAPAWGWDIKLVLSPQKAPAGTGRVSLLPLEESLTDGDAVLLYEKAVESLPDKAGDEQIQKWLEIPDSHLPVEQVEKALAPYRESLKYVARAAKCRQCNWPQPEMWKEGVHMEDYRRLVSAIRLWARLEMASDEYDGAIVALQTGFGMIRHLGRAPTIIQTLNAVSLSQAMCLDVEKLVQTDGFPNLYTALGSLPRPFIYAEMGLQNEVKVASAPSEGKWSEEQIESQVKTEYDRVRAVAKRIDRHIAALQCVEAIRSYVVSHGGQLPRTLAEITENPVPKDPISGEPFRYTRTGSTAALESAIPPDGKEKVQVRYEISIRN